MNEVTKHVNSETGIYRFGYLDKNFK